MIKVKEVVQKEEGFPYYCTAKCILGWCSGYDVTGELLRIDEYGAWIRARRFDEVCLCNPNTIREI